MIGIKKFIFFFVCKQSALCHNKNIARNGNMGGSPDKLHKSHALHNSGTNHNGLLIDGIDHMGYTLFNHPLAHSGQVCSHSPPDFEMRQLSSFASWMKSLNDESSSPQVFDNF